MRRRAAVEPVTGHLKDGSPLAPATVSRAATATASMPCSPPPGYNFSLLRRWFEELLRALLLLTFRHALLRSASKENILHGRLRVGPKRRLCAAAERALRWR